MAWNGDADTKKRKHHSLPKRIIVVMVISVVLIAASLVLVRHIYNRGLAAVSTDQTTQIITVKSGSSSKVIAEQLADEKLIRSAWAFELYVHSKNLGDKLQAGTYALSPSQSTPSMINTLTKGVVTTDLVTILPGKRIDQIRAGLINDGFTPDDVDKALDPAQYADVPVLAYKPAGASLEGLLYPDSYQRTADTGAATIVRESLKEMSAQLTTERQATYAAQGLTAYQGIVLASILEKEVSRPSDRAQAAQVFLKRLKTDMMLGSDVTAYYGAVLAGKSPVTTYDSAYNTLIRQGLPPTPISSVSLNSLTSAGKPASTDWLFFVSGDNGTTYFSTNLQEHEAYTAKYCHKLCGE
ncbi:endolytic transglycosylase MltG [Aeromicrobium sp.]|nr:endolytic transglycosylase MltG [Candidatus Saccharibacteria bacterium]